MIYLAYGGSYPNYTCVKIHQTGTFLVIQWLRFCLSMQRVQSPVREVKTPQALQPKKQKQFCNKFNKDLKNGPHQNKKKILLKVRKTVVVV